MLNKDHSNINQIYNQVSTRVFFNDKVIKIICIEVKMLKIFILEFRILMRAILDLMKLKVKKALIYFNNLN